MKVTGNYNHFYGVRASRHSGGASPAPSEPATPNQPQTGTTTLARPETARSSMALPDSPRPSVCFVNAHNHTSHCELNWASGPQPSSVAIHPLTETPVSLANSVTLSRCRNMGSPPSASHTERIRTLQRTTVNGDAVGPQPDSVDPYLLQKCRCFWCTPVRSDPWTSLICVSSPKCVYMCVRCCPPPNTKCVYMCVTKCVYMCVTKCVYMCVTKCVYMCVTKCVC